MEKIYVINTDHGYEELLNRGLTNKAFRTKERCEEIISEMSESNHGKPVYSENSEYVKLVKQYWDGDFSLKELEEKIGNKKDTDTAFNSALYYDFMHMFWVKEYEISE